MQCSVVLRVALAVSNANDREFLRHQLIRCAIESQGEVDIAYLCDQFGLLQQNFTKYDLVIADEKALKENVDQLHALYCENPECITLLTGMEASKVCNYLALRPSGYLDNKRKDVIIKTFFDMQIELRRTCNSVIQVRTREGIFAVTTNDILHCQSDLKYVIITTSDGKRYRRLGKLDDLMSLLPSHFLRIHQSYMINKKQLRGIDRAAHELILRGSVRVPYSRIYSKEVNALFQN